MPLAFKAFHFRDLSVWALSDFLQKYFLCQESFLPNVQLCPHAPTVCAKGQIAALRKKKRKKKKKKSTRSCSAGWNNEILHNCRAELCRCSLAAGDSRARPRCKAPRAAPASCPRAATPRDGPLASLAPSTQSSRPSLHAAAA